MNKAKINESPEAIDDLAMQNMIRKRYCTNWPDTILQLTKRVRAVNQTWADIILKIMRIEGLRVTYAREGDVFVITVFACELRDRPEQTERHEVPLKEVQDAQQYIEVLVMDKLSNSKLIAELS